MQIIPVVDILSGQVVHARSGSREYYEPIQSCLTKYTNPADIVAAFLDLYPFQRIYIADLDAIQKKGNNQTSISNLIESYANIEFWIDSGLDKKNQFHNYAITPNSIPVYGTENKLELQKYEVLLNNYPELILSLDFTHPEIKENTDIMNNPGIWPDNIIAMSLYKVGSNSGPDFNLLNKLMPFANNKALYAAGGVRGEKDGKELKLTGVQGILVASALHSGALNRHTLAALSR